MPTIDPELIAPLSKISDVLLKRPGKVTMEGIKRLSNIYGFETFNDTLTGTDNNNLIYASYGSGSAAGSNVATPISGTKDHNAAGQVIERLSLSGKILLLDIDFQEESVTNVSLSSAINIQTIENKTYDFIEGGDSNFEKVQKILFKNLQFKTLDKFNKNLRILSQFDRLSLNSPNDLFNFFNQLTYNLMNIHEYELNKSLDAHESHSSPLTKQELEQDLKYGFNGLGQVLLNQSDKIGLFLKYWEDNRFLNTYLFEKKQILTNENLNPYLIHFKITENNKPEIESRFSDILNSSTTQEPSGASTAVASDLKVKWFENGEWLINKHDTDLLSNLSLLELEFCPCVWIPEDLLIELGLTNYEIITQDNEFFNYNGDENYDSKLDQFYKCINSQHYTELKIIIDDDSENDDNEQLQALQRFKVNYLTGCKFIKIYKIKFNRLDKLLKLVHILRNWCLIHSLIRNLLSKEVVPGTADDNKNNIVNNSNAFGNSSAASGAATNNTTSMTVDNNYHDDENLLDIQDDLRLNDIIKENINLLDESNEINNEKPLLTENNLSVINIESIRNSEINVIINVNNNGSGKKKIAFTIENGLISSKDLKLSKILLKTEDLTAIILMNFFGR